MKGRRCWVGAAVLVLGLGMYGTGESAQMVIMGCGSIGAGSYVLTSDVTATGAGPCITITANDVMIDFQGFQLIGVGDPTISDIGIQGTGTGPTNIVIRNGTIRDFSLGGILLPNSEAARVEGMQIIDNGGTGIDVGESSIVRDNIVTGTSAPAQGTGMRVGAKSLISGNIVNNNRLTGIIVTCPSSVLHNTAQGNTPNVPKNGSQGCKSVDNLF